MLPNTQAKLRHRTNRPSARQNGAALLVLLVIVIIATTGVLLNSLNRSSVALERDRITAEALAQAKEALIGRAVSNASRPGSLPCPDTKSPSALTAGDAEGTCPINAIGRLPWKTLGLGDLRDGSGERLWYALSNNFRSSSPVVLNSDTLGQLTITGTNPASNVAAIIFSPGSVIGSQNRSVTPTALCTTTNSTIAPDRCAANYLEGENSISNATYVTAATSSTFNDRLLTITYEDLMPKLEKRVVGEVLKCLTDYALELNNGGRYPWAADIVASGSGDYSDVTSKLFGRVPDTLFTRTNTSSGGIGGMSDNWQGGSCNIVSGSGWWLNWKELVFYGLADAYKPFNPPATATACGTCLAVNPPSATANKQVVVIVAGKRLSGVASGQPRTTAGDKGNIANYLENPNQGGVAFAPGLPTSTTLNDVLGYR